MTLEEAIRHCEEKAKELRTPRAYTDIKGNLRATETCEECAEEHEQLAEWLKELRRYRNCNLLRAECLNCGGCQDQYI